MIVLEAIKTSVGPVESDFTTSEINLADLRSSCASIEKKCQMEPNVEDIIIISSLTKTRDPRTKTGWSRTEPDQDKQNLEF